MSTDLPDLIKLLTKFQQVEREIFVPELGRKENDSEHSYNLVMAAWFIISRDKLPLDLDLVVRYALVHDLVEVYADDAFVFDEKQEPNYKKIRSAETSPMLLYSTKRWQMKRVGLCTGLIN